ncbi:MAG: squalene--hopene cyclase [Planctomycetota bacterium]|jgi:squalene-hopene/tetraprenyl-beta-curcumene cyclase
MSQSPPTARPAPTGSTVADVPLESEFPSVSRTLRRAIDALVGLQHADGHWRGELEGDSILESEYILMKCILGHQREPMVDGRPGPQVLARIARHLRALQRPDGGWGQYPGSAIDLSATVKAYFALKLLGDDPDNDHMTRARDAVLRLGGAERSTSFTNFYLACLGQVSWNAVPEIPPEIVLLPGWFYFNLNKVSAWTRTMIMPLSIVSALRPTRLPPPTRGIDELFIDARRRHRLTSSRPAAAGWSAFFGLVDRALKAARRLGGTPLRRWALARAERWILARAGQDGPVATDGLGAIFPPMVYIQIVLDALGYPREHAAVRRAERELDALFIEDGDTIRIQPCFSPVWDTGIALCALAECGLTVRQPPLRRAARWLTDRQCTHRGDWSRNLKHPVEPAAWWFEYHNAWYPDVDDTAIVAMALGRVGGSENVAAARRGVRWLLAMQNDDGGWAAFDRTRHRRILEYIPFADHNAMQDPSCPDITGRVLECLSGHGFTNEQPAVRRAIGFIKRCQEPDGCWWGRWGVNYIYGTWQAVIGPIRCGEDAGQAWVRQAGRWVKSIQKADGSFGESANSYEDPSVRGQGPSTASQTAWAAMILQAVFGPADPDLGRAISWLIEAQLTEEQAANAALNPDGDPPGSWVEPWFTGTGFPRVFYLRYHLYRLYFPIMAIGRYLRAGGGPVVGEPKIKVMPKVRWDGEEGTEGMRD